MSKGPDRIERMKQQAKLDEKRDQRLEREANENDARRTEQPKDTPRGSQ